MPSQAPSAWSTLTLPSGFVASNLFAHERVLAYRDLAQGVLRVYSPFTGTWATTPTAGSATIGDDYAGVLDAAGVRLFSTWSGRFETLPGPTAFSTAVFGSSFVLGVQNGTVHVFSALTGNWHSAPMPTGWSIEYGPRMLVARPAMHSNPLQAMAFDMHTGNWHTLSPQPYPLTVVRIVGTSVVLGSSNSYVFAFSAIRPTWVGTSTFARPGDQINSYDCDYCLCDGLLYSGLTGTFLPGPSAPFSSPTVAIHGKYATAQLQGPPWVFFASGPGHNTWVPTQGQPAFSPLLNSHQLPPGGVGGAYQVGYTAVAGVPGVSWAFSAYTGQWHAGPVTVTSSRASHNSALFETPNGIVGFAAPTASFATNPIVATAISGYAAVGGGKLLAFDAHGARWLEHPYAPTGGAQPTLGTRVVIASDATRALGFGVRGRRLEALPISGPATAVGAREDYGYVVTGNQIHAFSGLADTVTWQNAPDGNYGVAVGTRADIQVRTPPGHIVVFGFGQPAAAPIPLPPYGELWIDPTSLTTQLFVAPPMPTAGRAVVSLTIPSVPALRGTRWLQQAFTIPPSGIPYLGEPSTLLVQ